MHQFIAILFLSRDIAHKHHLKTRNYAHHITLEKFYTEIVDLTDRLTEVYQGRNGIIEKISLVDMEINTDDIVDILNHLLGLLENSRYQVVSEKDTSIQAIIDEIVELYLHTLSLLRQFQ